VTEAGETRLVRQMLALALDAGARIMRIYAGPLLAREKPDRSPVTEADHAAEAVILEGLVRAEPRTPVISEEAFARGHVPQVGRRFFLVDPLDGTKEFLSRNGEFTVNIALVTGQRPVLGVVHVPILDLTYWAADGQGAFRTTGEHTTQLHANRTLSRPLRVVASRSHAGPTTEAFLTNLRHDYALEVVSKGSSLKFCLVAEGTADLYPRLGPTMEWDTAAAQCIVTQAGGQVTTLQNTPLQYNKTNLLNPFFMVSSPATGTLWKRYLQGVAVEASA
jgi:3'(2'), 5'-bisphosphate nucleotidase